MFMIQRFLPFSIALLLSACALDSQPSSESSGSDQAQASSDTDTASEDLRRRSLAGTYVLHQAEREDRLRCNAVGHLVLEPGGTFIATTAIDVVGHCPELPPAPARRGRWTQRGGLLKLFQGSTLVAQGDFYGSGFLGLHYFLNAEYFFTDLVRLGAGQCAVADDCLRSEVCVPQTIVLPTINFGWLPAPGIGACGRRVSP